MDLRRRKILNGWTSLRRSFFKVPLATLKIAPLGIPPFEQDKNRRSKERAQPLRKRQKMGVPRAGA
jgi:hypothetical protein